MGDLNPNFDLEIDLVIAYDVKHLKNASLIGWYQLFIEVPRGSCFSKSELEFK